MVDVLTLDEARTAAKIKGDQYDVELGAVVSAVSERLDALCGPIVNRTVTETRDGDGCSVILLRDPPVVSFTSITEYAGTTATVLTVETNATKPTDAYLHDRGKVIRRSNGADIPWYPGRQNIVFVYTAGRGTVATIPERFKQAAAITVAHMWSNAHGSGNSVFGTDGEFQIGATFSFPRRAVELLKGDALLRGVA